MASALREVFPNPGPRNPLGLISPHHWLPSQVEARPDGLAMPTLASVGATIPRQDAEASSCEHVGLSYLDDGDAATAAIWFERGLRLYVLAGGNPRGEAILHRHLARARTSLGSHQAAASHLRSALEGFTTLGDSYGQAAALTDTAELHLAEGDPDQAVTALHQAPPLAGHAASPFLQARALTVLADAWTQARSNTTQARARLTQVSQLHDQLRIPKATRPARAQALAARLPGSAGDDPV